MACETITLQLAKQLMEIIEKRAEAVGLKAVIALCNAHGNPIAVPHQKISAVKFCTCR